MAFDIQVSEACLSYGAEELFHNLNFTIPQCSCACLLGPSGVGKSSLLQAIAGVRLDRYSNFQGKIIASDGESLAGRVMLMSQQDSLLPWLDVLENVLIGYRLRNESITEVRAKAESLLQALGLEPSDFSKRPKSLSGGMRQRVALVRMLVEDKPLWLLDEPFAALDAITRYKLQNLFAIYWKEKTVLLVTHDPLEALRLADVVYVMCGRPAFLEKIKLPNTSTPRELTPELLAIQEKILASLGG